MFVLHKTKRRWLVCAILLFVGMLFLYNPGPEATHFSFLSRLPIAGAVAIVGGPAIAFAVSLLQWHTHIKWLFGRLGPEDQAKGSVYHPE
jgi:hypothetical protein